MSIRSKEILLLCIFGYVNAQFLVADVVSQRTATTLKPRFQRLQTPRTGSESQTATIATRARRPIPLSRSRPIPTTTGSEYLPVTNLRPRPVYISPLAVKTANVPTATQKRQKLKPEQQHQQAEHDEQQEQEKSIKPVSEEIEEEVDVAQAIANLGTVSALAQQSGNLLASPLAAKPTIGLLKYQGGPPAVAKPAPPAEENIAPIQYKPQHPFKLRKLILEDAGKIRKTPQQQQQQYHQQVQSTAKTLPRGSQAKDNYSPPHDEYSQSREKYPGSREKKRVAQIIRRWRDDNPDGSITWGFENDDGSYKEELIGIDCITRGKYGYIDLDGLRREYSYETGIKCDEEELEEDRENGFVDYQENKLVLPNGKTIDLSSMGKKQARRPKPIYRN